MDDESKKKKFLQEVAKNAELERIRKDTQAKRILLDSRRIDLEISKTQRAEQELARAKDSNFGQISDKLVEEIRKDNVDYIKAAKKAMIFINDTFQDVVPYFRKNLILVGGKTGEGKSTAVANIAYSTISQKNPEGKRCRALVISNEEVVADVYNRVTCLARGWQYTNHDRFTDDQIKAFDEAIPVWAKDGRLTVIDNNYNGATGVTTSLEGIQTIFDNLIQNKDYYDVVIIDYYQNVKFSKKDTSLNEYEVQARLAALLDQYKNEYPAPIVLMAQVNPPDTEGKTPFEYRIKGRKVITDPATIIIEMVAERDRLRTKWVVHKSRFTESVGKAFYTGYERGRFVEYTTEFQRHVAAFLERRNWALNTDADVTLKENKDE